MAYRLYFFILLAVSFVFVGTVSAVTITPTKQSLTLDAGTQKTVFVTVTNNSDEDVVLTTSVDPFTVDGETGAAQFGASDVAQRWVSISPVQSTVRANDVERIAYTIAVPKDAVPGSHYLGLFAETAPAAGAVTARSRIGSLLFLYVAGEFQESLVQQDFSPDSRVFVGEKPSLFFHARNEGNIHVIPQIDIVATDVFGRVVAATKINEEQIKVLPGESFVRPIVFDTLPQTVVGPVDVRARISYGLTEQTFFSHTRFWIVPPLFIGSLVFIVVCAVLVTVFYKRRSV